MASYVRYANQNAIRNQPLNPRLAEAFGFLPELGLEMEVFSGGETEDRRASNSGRHLHGNAADVFFSRNGQRLNWANEADVPVFQDIVRRAKAAGVTGFGAGPGYMQPGSMHVGFGAPSVWGAGGKSANAPSWLREAYGVAQANAAQASAAPSGGSLARMMSPEPMAQQTGQIQSNADVVNQIQRAMLGDIVAPRPPVQQDFASVIQNYRGGQIVQEQAKQAEAQRLAALFADYGSNFG